MLSDDLGPSVDPEGLPELMRVPLQFAVEIARSAIGLFPSAHKRTVKTYITGGDGSLGRAYRDTGSGTDHDTYFVVLDALAPFQLLELLHRLHANAYSEGRAAAIWLRRPAKANDEPVVRLTDGESQSPAEALPVDWHERCAWSLAFLALHEIGHIRAGHIDEPTPRQLLRDLQNPAELRTTGSLRARQRELEADRMAAQVGMLLITERRRDRTALQELTELLYGASCIFLLQSLLDHKHIADREGMKAPSEGETHPSGAVRMLNFFGSCRQLPFKGVAQSDIETVVDEVLDLVKRDWTAARWTTSMSDEDVIQELEATLQTR